jgi:hypothetical protein
MTSWHQSTPGFWFTEGFDTADLKEVRALLEALVE